MKIDFFIRCLIFCMLVICTYASFSQSTDFINKENEIKTDIRSGKWDAVLMKATDLIIEDISRGEGFYYTALSFYKTEDIDKAKEYLSKAEKLDISRITSEVESLKKGFYWLFCGKRFNPA